MEKDIGKIRKNDQSEIIIRIDDFGGKRGLTIREFVTSDRYTGFTKAGVRILGSDFAGFKEMINSISEKEILEGSEGQATLEKSDPENNSKEDLPDY